MFRSPRPSSMAKRHLIDPSTHHLPWSVDVVSLVPKGVVDPSSGTPIAGAIHGKWACCAFSSGFFYVWQIKTTTLNEPLETPKEFIKFFLPDFATAPGAPVTEASKPLVALTPSQGENDSINLYILHSTSGKILLKKISRRDLHQSGAVSQSHHHSTSSRIVDPTLGDDETTLEDGETFQSLACENSLVVVATSRGQLFLVTHTAVPFGLHVQKVEATQSGFLSRFFGSSPTVGVAGSGATHVLPLSSTNFLALSIDSGLVEWKIEQKIAAGHHAVFQPTVRLERFGKALQDQSWDLVSIRKIATTVDHRNIHAIVEGNLKGESRLYWVVLDAATGSLLRSHWLSRFALPDQVGTIGLVACETGATYASFAAGDSVILMVLLGEGEDFIQEVDLPSVQVPGVLPGMMCRDMVTHGSFMIASSGIALRSRYMPQESTSPSKRARLETRGGLDHVPVQTLVSHLRSHFWESYKNPTVDRPMPPSLLQSDGNREKAIINVAMELQRKGGSTSPSIAMEWHEAFVKMTLDGGLYRCLSDESKWRMFAIGQEISVCKEIADTLLHKHKHADVDWIESLQPYDLGGWFLKIQANEELSGWQNVGVWHDILCLAFDEFWKFREMTASIYDIHTDDGPLTWIGDHSMQDMFRRQLRIFKANPASAPSSVIEVVVKTALFSYHQTWYVSQNDESKEKFAKMQKAAISLLRMTNGGNDEVAFDLCSQYEYFEGLCEISLSHERKSDAKSYALDSLFDSIHGRDLLNNLTFPQFVMQYHADRRLYGHVINYGRLCINDLGLIMERNDNLRQYRWIPSIRQGHFDQATNLCLENCEESMDIDKLQWNLSFAKLSNKLVASQNQQVLNRQKDIEKNLDLVEAQQLLVGDDTSAGIHSLMPPEKLIDLALNKLADAYDIDDRVKFALIALAVCTSISDESVVFENTSKVWSECLLLNGAQWTEWSTLGFGEDLQSVREEALTETVFGVLLRECRKDHSLAKVTYGRHIESEVIDRVQGDENRESFTRLLRTVATPTDTVVGESMMVSSF